MPKTPEFLPIETAAGWMVSIPKTMTATGQRVRKYFPAEKDARKFAGKLRAAHASGIRGGVISATLALQAAEAERILDGSGISLVEAARMAVARSGGDTTGETLKARLARSTLANEGRWSGRYRLDMAKLHRWVPSLMSRKCSTIDRAAVEVALVEKCPLTRATIDSRAARVLAAVNYRDRHRKSQDIAIMSDAEVSGLLEACESAAETWAVALLLFAGIRPDSEHGEITRLDWSDVGAKEIYVSREASKTSDRHIPIYPRLRRLLKGHPKSGPVIPPNWKRVWARLRKTAGITAQDVTRHTFASHLLSWKGMAECQAAMGHVPLSSVTRAHYARSVTSEAGKRYFR